MQGEEMAEESDTVLVPYLVFNGNAAEAMKFYQTVLGGELTMRTFGEALIARNLEEKDRIVHATLRSDYFAFMACDTPLGSEVRCGSNIHLRLGGKDSRRLGAIFRGLAAGGQVTTPMSRQVLGDTFGMVKDKFGVRWMINIEGRPRLKTGTKGQQIER
jgi:PhnB protein